MRTNSIIAAAVSLAAAIPAGAQGVLTLDSCRSMALRNNKQLSVTALKQDVAMNTRKAARTKYLPHVSVAGGYTWTSREISILNNDQKAALSGLGTSLAEPLNSSLSSLLTGLVGEGMLTADQATKLGSALGETGTSLSSALNETGKKVKDAFRTDTRNIFAASAMLTQPIYMGGAITAANRMADITEQMAANSRMDKTQGIIYDIDKAYWTVVSLKQKRRLAESYLTLISKLNDDVAKMIREGVATRADGLKVSVKVNEAEMTLTQVDNGLSLSKMLLCQLCGLPVSSGITLADEDDTRIDTTGGTAEANAQTAMDNRPELRLLQNMIDMSEQAVRLTRAAFLPQIALTGGYLISNPNVFNGYEKKFGGVWNVGVMVRIPVWNWFEGTYKVRAAKGAAAIAQLELADAQEKVELQVTQSQYRLNEAHKRLAMARKNTESAEENLRCANLGFREGVMQSTEVMEAQTAWLQAQTQKIDAEIDVKLSQASLRKAMGELTH